MNVRIRDAAEYAAVQTMDGGWVVHVISHTVIISPFYIPRRINTSTENKHIYITCADNSIFIRNGFPDLSVTAFIT